MSKEQKRQALALIPPALALAIAFIYLLFFGAYVECKDWLTRCSRITAVSVYPIAATASQPSPGSLPTPAEQLKGVNEKQEELSRKSEALQGQLLEVSKKRAELVNALSPAKLDTEELSKLEKVSDAIDKEKTETDDALTILDARKKSLGEAATSQKDKQEGSQKLAIERHSKRLTWVLFTSIFVLACAGVLLLALYLPHHVQEDRKHPAHLLLGLTGLYVVYGLARWFFDSRYDTVYEEIVGLLKGDTGYLPRLSEFFDILGNTAAFALAVTVTLLLWHSLDFFKDNDAEFDTKLKVLSERKKYLQIVLYAGTILMVVGIFRMSVLLTWVQSYVMQVGLQTPVDEFSKVLVSFQGVLYSLLLLAIYLSARQIITERAWSLPTTADAATRQTKLSAAGFAPATERTFKEVLPKAVVVLAPLFAGPLMKLVEKIFT